MKAKEGIIGAAALAVVVVAGGRFLLSGGDGVEISNSMEMVCVATGRTFVMSRGDVASFPAMNPDTQTKTLVPCIRRDDGVFVKKRYASLLTEQLKAENKYVDPETLAVKKNE